MRSDLAPPAHLWAFNVNTAAERLNIPATTLRARIRNGSVRAARIGQRYYIPLSEMERLLTPVGCLTKAERPASEAQLHVEELTATCGTL